MIVGSLLFVGGTRMVSGAEPAVAPPPPAAVAPLETPEFLKPDAVPSFPLMRVIVTLALLLGAMYFVLPLLKKTKWGVGPRSGSGLDIVGRAYLGPRAGLCLVQAEGRRFLVGVGADGVRLLAELGGSPSRAPQPESIPHA